MGKRNTIHKLPEYKGYSAYYYYDDEDKLWVGHVYNSTDGEFADMVAWVVAMTIVFRANSETFWALLFGAWAINVILAAGDDD